MALFNNRQCLHPPLANESLQHRTQAIGIRMEMGSQVCQGSMVVLGEIGLKIGKNHEIKKHQDTKAQSNLINIIKINRKLDLGIDPPQPP